ncbi:MAG: hypothetical protein ACHQNT_13060 [Bacteroidia bacterium]
MKIQAAAYFVIPFISQMILSRFSFAQVTGQSRINIQGKVIDTEIPAISLPALMVVNLSTGQGIFGNNDGTFQISVFKNDTVLISAIGYTIKKICFTDSVFRNHFSVTIPLSKLKRDLQEVEIFPERNLKSIESDIQQLGYDEKNYRLTGIDAWSSPLTALYQQYSKKEKDKRRAAQLWNNEKRNDLLKELFRLYDKNKLINLPAEKYDEFAGYLNITDEMMKMWTQYELAVYIKSKYERFTAKK